MASNYWESSAEASQRSTGDMAMTVAGMTKRKGWKGSNFRCAAFGLLAVAGLCAPLPVSGQVGPNIVITPGVITTFAGSSSNGSVGLGNGGPAASATVYNPAAVRFDGAGNLYILDAGNFVIRKVTGPGQTGAGTIATFAGNGKAGNSGDGGQATSASFSATARGLYVNAAGVIWISDSGNNAIRKIDATGKITTVAGTNGAAAGYTGDAGQATAATLNNPGGIYVDAAGNLYIADTGNNVIRVVNTSGVISTFAGGATSVCKTTADALGDGCPIAQSVLLGPTDVYGDAAGNLDIYDSGDFRVRKANATTGLITSIVGTGTKGNGGDGGAATGAAIGGGNAIFIDSIGDLFVVDVGYSKVRFVTPAGTIYSVAGNGTAAGAGDGSSATTANLNLPMGVTVDSQNNVYIADTGNSRIREVQVNNGSLTLAAAVIAASSATSVATVLNTGASPLAFTSITITPPFSEKNGVATDCTTTKTIAVGATCTLTLLYTPTAAGYVSGTATLQSTALNATSGTSTIQLFGDGLPTQGTIASTTTLATSFTGVPTTTAGQPVTLTATVSGVSTAAPTGTVVFTTSGGSVVLGTTALAAASTTSAVATLTLTTLPTGTDSVVATYLGDTTFKTSASAAQLIAVFTGTMDFGFTATPAATTVAYGSGLPVVLNVFSINGYSSTIGFQCTNLPPGANCLFQPFTTFLGAGRQSTPNVTVTINFPLAQAQERKNSPRRPVGETAFALLCFGAIALRKRSRGTLPAMVLLLCLSAVGLVSLSGCSSAPVQASLKGTYNIQIVASDNSISHTVTVPVSVQ